LALFVGFRDAAIRPESGDKRKSLTLTRNDVNDPMRTRTSLLG
jgi:hypothetical protein